MELSKNKASLYASLSSKKMRMKQGLFLAEGEKCALDMLGGFDLEALVATGEWSERRDLAEITEEKLMITDRKTLDKISSLTTPSEVIAVFRLPALKLPPLDSKGLYLMLDGIQDPGNLGTIIRTADWFGINTIIASRTTVDVFNPKTVQASMGSLKRVKVFYEDLKDIIKENPTMPVYGTLLDGKSIFDSELSSHGFIIMGNEGNGISEGLRPFITDRLLIPPYNDRKHAESLNVAIATAIVLAQFRGK